MSKQLIEQLTLFNYVKCDVKYVKQHITLKNAVSVLSDKRRRSRAAQRNKNHSTSDFSLLDAAERQRRQTETQ